MELDGVGWSWMELGGVGWSWMELDGVGWSRMELELESPSPPPGEVIAVGMGLVFCGITTGGSGGGGM